MAETDVSVPLPVLEAETGEAEADNDEESGVALVARSRLPPSRLRQDRMTDKNEVNWIPDIRTETEWNRFLDVKVSHNTKNKKTIIDVSSVM